MNTSAQQSHQKKRALTTAEAAEYCGLSQSTLRQSRMSGKRYKRINAPRYTRLGGKKIVYLLDDLDAWLEKQRDSTAA